jgi:hypothetical protein
MPHFDATPPSISLSPPDAYFQRRHDAFSRYADFAATAITPLSAPFHFRCHYYARHGRRAVTPF